MGEIKKLFKRKSLKTSFAYYMIFCILAALVMSFALSNLFSWGQTTISSKYLQQYDQYSHEITIGDDESYNVQLHTEDITKFLTKTECVVYKTFGLMSVGIYPICFIFFIILTSILFYKRQLYKPLLILSDAADNIADNNLDFCIDYDKDNELGKLCASFEKMRIALRDNNLEMWRQMEERKRLNAAFAHDLRTPLTVLKGQSEMLAQYAPKMSEDKIVSTAEMMKRHIIRLEAYVSTMNDLQRLEDIEVKKAVVEVKEFEHQMRTTSTAICNDKEFALFQNLPDTQSLKIDISVIMQVYENLLSNAVRYAKKKIEVTVDEEDDYLMLTVADDGVGFTSKDLSNAMKPFYKAESEPNNEHFGMGLNICKTLCEKHGGYLQISNENGAKVVAAFKE